MIIQELTLANFRNFEKLNLEFAPGVNVFLGDNGQGKTNLLEALFLLTRGQTFRPSSHESLLRKNAPAKATAEAKVLKQNLDYRVTMSLDSQKKQFLVNSKRQSGTYLSGMFPSVLFSPESLAAIKEGPEQRRVLVDDCLITHEASNARLIVDYKRALRSRNRLLKDYKLGHYQRSQILGLLESLDGSFIPLSSRLTHKRITALRDIAGDFSQAVGAILNLKDVEIAVEYVVSGQSALNWGAQEVFDAINQRRLELASSEIDAGMTLVGPHKHDIRFLFKGDDSRYFCSQGQQRALILAFKMAQIMYHYKAHQDYPFLMLDDVLSELDQDKRANLIGFLQGIDAQIFLTTTDLKCPREFKNRKLATYEIAGGKINRAS